MAALPMILVPVDFDESSTRAIETAKRFALAIGAEILLVHVVSAPVWAYPEVPAELVQRIHDEARRAATRSLEELATVHGGVRCVIREGDPAVCIVALCDELAPRMVVMGTHGRHGISRLLLGSVAERVIRRSPVPVLSVRARAA